MALKMHAERSQIGGSSMRRLLLLGLVGLAFTSGCDLYLGPDDPYTYCDDTGCYTCDNRGCDPGLGECQTNWDCAGGCYCGDGRCVETGMCRTTADCSGDLVCDSRSSCVPLSPSMCDADSDCPDGFCDERAGSCIASNTCARDSDCGPGRACDTRGVCVPATCTADEQCLQAFYCDELNGNCVESRACAGDGDCTQLNMACDEARGTCVPQDVGPPPVPCAANGDCAAGQTCCDGVCKQARTPTADSCTYDGECGGGDCELTVIGGVCHAACTSNDQCGTGDSCQAGFCHENPTPTPECVFNHECADGGVCINATCHASCTADTDCTNLADFCDQGICQPDWRPVSECSLSSDCDTAAGEQCVDGQCRTRCMDDSDCDLCVDGPTCVMGYCQEVEIP